MKKRRLKLPPLRLPADGAQAVSQLASGTGWPVIKALAFIVRAGWDALNCGAGKIPAMRAVMDTAVIHHEARLAMKKRLAFTAKKLRDAQQALGRKEGGAR